MSLAIENLKFTIFGSGHDYTLNNSGTGEGTRVFSHPYVPLGSSLYAGQFYFIVPDDNGNLIDAVKDDIAHCTFTPAIGSTFDAEGEQTVKVEYEREYIHDEETILIKRSFTEKVEVVDHGNVSTNYGNKYTLYDDGYLFFHPSSMSTVVAEMFYHKIGASFLEVTKVSSLPWRVNSLGGRINAYDYGGLLSYCGKYDYDLDRYIPIDISELKYADVSNVTSMKYMFRTYGTYITDYSALEDWDVSKVTDFESAFVNRAEIYDEETEEYTYLIMDDLSFLSKWDVSSATNMKSMISVYVKSLHGLENWDISNATDITYMLGNWFLTDISALADWDVSNITDFTGLFAGSDSLESLHGLENWDVSNGINFSAMFSNCASMGDAYDDPDPGREYILNLSAITDWDMSNAQSLSSMFAHSHIEDLSPIADWDVSNVTSLESTFEECYVLEDISALADWNVSKVTTLVKTFYRTPITSLEPLADWDVSSVTNMSYTFCFCNELQSLHGLEDWDVSNVATFNQAGWGNSDGTFTCLHLTDISALANWDVSKATSFRYMFELCAWLFDITPLANWDMSKGDLKFMFCNDNTYYSSLLGKRVYYHSLYGDTYYEDYQGNRYISGVYDSDHPLQLIDKDASSAQNWNVGTGSGKGAFPTNWINRPTWN